ncbi:MAG: energy transducer TonB [Pseudomonadota bacterium]
MHVFVPRLLGLMAALLMLVALPAAANFTPPKNLDPQNSGVNLDKSFTDEAWLVYTYDIDDQGEVINATIHSSNGVPTVEQAVLGQINAMRFSPATRNGKPVKVSADPIFFTWILDKPREMTPTFSETYALAWDEFKQGNYDGALDYAVQLKSMPGRNAYEEVKFQVLAASIMSRWDDEAAELQHLGRAVELQELADKNDFINPYIESGQYLMILDRIHTLKLNGMMLADASEVLAQIQSLAPGTEVAQRSQARHAEVEAMYAGMIDVAISAELTPIYREGPGSWKTGLSRTQFTISNVRGKILGVYLACDQGDVPLRYPSSTAWVIPGGWTNCEVDVSGRAGTRFKLNQKNAG